ncbi:MAG: hypothetical protein ACPG06_00690 [Alphaproteobacteria bacterium]
MRVFATIGLILALFGLAVLAYDVAQWLEFGGLELTAVGDIWYAFHAASLNLVQAVIERYLWPPLWDPLLTTVLLWPAGIVDLIFGLLMFFGAKSRIN